MIQQGCFQVEKEFEICLTKNDGKKISVTWMEIKPELQVFRPNAIQCLMYQLRMEEESKSINHRQKLLDTEFRA